MVPARTGSFVRGRSLRLGMLAAFAMLAVAIPTGSAQTPAAAPAGSHPAHIHSGTCAELGDVVVPLTNVEPVAGEATGPESALAVDGSRTIVDLPLADIIAGGHAVNVHLSDEEIGTYIACGDIGGVVVEDEDGGDTLVIGLGPVDDSGYVGLVWFGETADSQTEVSVQLIDPATED